MDVKKFIFDMYKGDVVEPKKFKANVKKNFGLGVREAHDLFVEIQNYQIKKYGKILTIDKGQMFLNTEECRQLSRKATQRRYTNRNKGR